MELRKRKVVDDKTEEIVKKIIRDVQRNGDNALIRYTRKFDNFDLNLRNIRVSRSEIREAYSRIDRRLINAMRHAKRNITRFHREQLRHIKKSWTIETEDGISIKQRIKAIESIGAYVPGGRASYPSTVLMNCIPAKVSKVKRIVLVSPPPISDPVLVAADICGVNEIYRIGGAQAIAALAYGTEIIKRVDKIIGPGNRFVMAAKKFVYGDVGIDLPAGPSEIMIIADETANPEFIASDILAQLEHGPDSKAVLVTNSREISSKTKNEIREQIKNLKRREILEKSLRNFTVVITKDIRESIRVSNLYAPEHLEIMARNSKEIVSKIENSGAIFLGDYSPVSAGDYASGSNHVLPTGGSARFSSELSVMDFLKISTVQKIGKRGLSSIKDTIDLISNSEGLDAHSMAVKIRFK